MMKGQMFWIGLAIGWAACGGKQAVEINPNADLPGPRWNAVLGTPSNLTGALQIKGTGWMAAAGPKDSSHTRAFVEITNAAPGGQHPWHVHRGSCGNDLGIFGEAKDYPVLEVKDDGRASKDATLNVPAPKTGEYFINVHASPTNLQSIIACGNLAPAQ